MLIQYSVEAIRRPIEFLNVLAAGGKVHVINKYGIAIQGMLLIQNDHKCIVSDF